MTQGLLNQQQPLAQQHQTTTTTITTTKLKHLLPIRLLLQTKIQNQMKKKQHKTHDQDQVLLIHTHHHIIIVDTLQKIIKTTKQKTTAANTRNQLLYHARQRFKHRQESQDHHLDLVLDRRLAVVLMQIKNLTTKNLQNYRDQNQNHPGRTGVNLLVVQSKADWTSLAWYPQIHL